MHTVAAYLAISGLARLSHGACTSILQVERGACEPTSYADYTTVTETADCGACDSLRTVEVVNNACIRPTSAAGTGTITSTVCGSNAGTDTNMPQTTAAPITSIFAPWTRVGGPTTEPPFITYGGGTESDECTEGMTTNGPGGPPTAAASTNSLGQPVTYETNSLGSTVGTSVLASTAIAAASTNSLGQPISYITNGEGSTIATSALGTTGATTAASIKKTGQSVSYITDSTGSTVRTSTLASTAAAAAATSEETGQSVSYITNSAGSTVGTTTVASTAEAPAATSEQTSGQAVSYITNSVGSTVGTTTLASTAQAAAGTSGVIVASRFSYVTNSLGSVIGTSIVAATYTTDSAHHPVSYATDSAGHTTGTVYIDTRITTVPHPTKPAVFTSAGQSTYTIDGVTVTTNSRGEAVEVPNRTHFFDAGTGVTTVTVTETVTACTTSGCEGTTGVGTGKSTYGKGSTAEGSEPGETTGVTSAVTTAPGLVSTLGGSIVSVYTNPLIPTEIYTTTYAANTARTLPTAPIATEVAGSSLNTLMTVASSAKR